MFGSFCTPRAFLLSLLLPVAAGAVACGENVLVGSWELSSSNDAGLDLPEHIVVDAGANSRAAVAAAHAREDKKRKNDQKANDDDHNGNGNEEGTH